MKRIELKGFCRVCSNPENGKMWAWDVCSCGGCFHHEYEIEEGDTIVAFRHISICHNSVLKNITLEAMRFITGNNVKLDNVTLISHPEAMGYYCGGAIYSNHGVGPTDIKYRKINL